MKIMDSNNQLTKLNTTENMSQKSHETKTSDRNLFINNTPHDRSEIKFNDNHNLKNLTNQPVNSNKEAFEQGSTTEQYNSIMKKPISKKNNNPVTETKGSFFSKVQNFLGKISSILANLFGIKSRTDKEFSKLVTRFNDNNKQLPAAKRNKID